ncbi:hypothetical protein NHQ30_009756 [Ciborinia camelliae]|nr:hypothetical protein NHQ30_009756 [Ciborinia camelliae]
MQAKAAFENPVQTQEIEAARIAEVEASRAATTDALLKPSKASDSSWWQYAKFWSNPQPASDGRLEPQTKELTTEAKKS